MCLNAQRKLTLKQTRTLNYFPIIELRVQILDFCRIYKVYNSAILFRKLY